MSNLLEQWNEHIIKGNQLSREIEKFDGIMHVADMEESEIVFRHNGNMTTFISEVLPQETMEAVKRLVVAHLTSAKSSKEFELDRLMGRKPATINPEFEAAVQDMVESAKKQKESDPVEDKLTVILQEQAKRIENKQDNEEMPPKEAFDTLREDYKQAKEIEHLSDKSMDKYPAKKDIKTPPNMNEADIRRLYVDEGKDRKWIANYYGITESKVNNYLYLHDIKRQPSRKPAETERP